MNSTEAETHIQKTHRDVLRDVRQESEQMCHQNYKFPTWKKILPL